MNGTIIDGEIKLRPGRAYITFWAEHGLETAIVQPDKVVDKVAPYAELDDHDCAYLSSPEREVGDTYETEDKIATIIFLP